MNFTDPSAVAEVVYQLKYADWSRSLNRAQIADLFNGLPPYTEEEVIQNRLDTNVNDLAATHIAMSARGQFGNALVTPDPLVNVELDYGPVYKRREWADTISREWNKRMKNSLPFQEEEESTFSSLVLHGIAPAVWRDKELWCPSPKGVEDLLVPGNTYRDLSNLPFYAVFEQYTGAQLYQLTHGPRVDPAWNMELVDALIQWVDQESHRLMGSGWPEAWSPEKWSERAKEDAGLFASDALPTIDTYHLYYWSDEGKNSGWRKKVILDAWANPSPGGGAYYSAKPKSLDRTKHNKLGWGEFLYDPGKRKYAEKLGNIVHWQFGDASSVAPFRYHSVRSLGFLLYAVCHLQNRLKCRFHDTVFENLMQYFRVANPTDMERVTQIDLINRKVIPEGVEFMKQADRWQVNQEMAQMAMEINRQVMADNSSNFIQDFDFNKEKGEETATRTMAKVNSTSALIGSMLNRAYNYQKHKLVEIGRRFCIKDSKDPDVRGFRVECLKSGVPEEALNINRWDISPVRVIGNGNKTMQVAMADKLMIGAYDKLGPNQQRELLRTFIAVNSDDWGLAARLVPESKPISDSSHDAQLAVGSLMAGTQMQPKEGVNYVDTIEALLHAMATIIQRAKQNGNMATVQEVLGLQNMAQYIGTNIKLLARDKTAKAKVKEYSDDLGKLQNEIKGFAQRLAEQAKQQNGSSQMDPKDLAKIQAIMLTAKTKSDISAKAHAQRTAERQISFQQKIHESALEHHQQMVKTDLEGQAAVRRGGMKSFDE